MKQSLEKSGSAPEGEKVSCAKLEDVTEKKKQASEDAESTTATSSPSFPWTYLVVAVLALLILAGFRKSGSV